MPNYSDKSFASRFVDNSFASRIARQDQRLKQLEADTANSDVSYRSDAGLGFVLEHSHPFMPWIDANKKWCCSDGLLMSRYDTLAVPGVEAIGSNTYLHLHWKIDTTTNGKFTSASFQTSNTEQGAFYADQMTLPLAKYDSTNKTVIPYFCYQNIVVPVWKVNLYDINEETGIPYTIETRYSMIWAYDANLYSPP